MRHFDGSVTDGRPACGNARRQDVHRWVAEEGRHRGGGRAREHLLGRPDLHDPPVHEDGHPVGQRHRLLLVVRHVHRRHVERALQALELHPGLDAQLRVEVRQRLVEQKERRLTYDRPRQRAALLLPAGKLAGSALEQVLDAHPRRGLAHRMRDPVGRGPDHLQGECDVVEHRHVRIQRIALEHHCDIAIARGQQRRVGAVELDLAFGGGLQPCDDAQGGGLARTRRAEQRKELARPDLQIDIVQHARVSERLADPGQPDFAPLRHLRPAPLIAPADSPATICFCAARPSTMTGSIATSAAAASWPHCVCSVLM